MSLFKILPSLFHWQQILLQCAIIQKGSKLAQSSPGQLSFDQRLIMDSASSFVSQKGMLWDHGKFLRLLRCALENHDHDTPANLMVQNIADVS